MATFHHTGKRTNTMNKNRDKGIRFELECIHILEELGFKAVSSRSESRALDNIGVDIVTDAPFNIQCKFTVKAPSYHRLLKEMPKDKAPIVMHKRSREGVVVVMTLSTFQRLLNIKE